MFFIFIFMISSLSDDVQIDQINHNLMICFNRLMDLIMLIDLGLGGGLLVRFCFGGCGSCGVMGDLVILENCTSLGGLFISIYHGFYTTLLFYNIFDLLQGSSLIQIHQT